MYLTVQLWESSISPTVKETTVEFYRYLCTGGASCTPALSTYGTWPKVVGNTVFDLEFLHPAMAIKRLQSGVEVVDILRREKVDDDCDNDGDTTEVAEAALDLRHYDYRTDTSVIAVHQMVSSNLFNSTNNACTDTGLSHIKNHTGDLYACYTFKINPLNGSQDRLQCNDNSTNPTVVWSEEVDFSSPVVEDHSAFDFKDGERVVIGNRRPAGSSDDEIRFHFPDAIGTPEFGIGVGADVDGGSVPDIMAVSVASGEVLHAAWEAEDATELRVGRCPATEDCQQASDWTVTTVHSITNGRIGHPELAHDGAFQILIWEEDDDLFEGEIQLYSMNRCGTGAWSTPELIRAVDNSNEEQGLLNGNPNMALNRQDNVAHVVFIEADRGANTSELWWARQSYTDCP